MRKNSALIMINAKATRNRIFGTSIKKRYGIFRGNWTFEYLHHSLNNFHNYCSVQELHLRCVRCVKVFPLSVTIVSFLMFVRRSV